MGAILTIWCSLPGVFSELVGENEENSREEQGTSHRAQGALPATRRHFNPAKYVTTSCNSLAFSFTDGGGHNCVLKFNITHFEHSGWLIRGSPWLIHAQLITRFCDLVND